MFLARMAVLDDFTVIWFVNGSTRQRGVHTTPSTPNSATSSTVISAVSATVMPILFAVLPVVAGSFGVFVPLDSARTVATVGRSRARGAVMFGVSSDSRDYCASSASSSPANPAIRTVFPIVSSVRLRCSVANRATKSPYRSSVRSE